MKKLEISKEDLKYNLDVIRKKISDNNKNVKIIAVLKANGMGLDLEKYASFLLENDIDCFAVANVEEALKLRKAGINKEILMLSPVSIKNELQLLIINDITITIGSYYELELAEELSKKLNKSINAHIKIDTGFGRYGFIYLEKEIILETFKRAQNVKIKGMFTHFSNPKNEKQTKQQFDRFTDIVSYIKQNDYEIEILHCCASTAFLKYPEMHLNAVRIGSAIQGRTLVENENFRKIGIFKTNIEEIKMLPKGYNISYGNTYKTKKEKKIAVIPVGYMDGFNKNKLRDDFSLKNNIVSVLIEIRKIFRDNTIKVKIKNKKYKVLGRLGMYHSIIDITNSKNINIGDEVHLDIAPLQANDEIRREYI